MTIDAGAYQAIGLNLGKISQDQLTALKAKLESTKAKLQNQDFAGLSKDDLIGDFLYATALAYHAELGTMNYAAAQTMGVNAISLPSETIFASKLNVALLWGIPRFVSSDGLNMDADYLMQVVKAKDGNGDTPRQYMRYSGMTSSALEHSVPEQLFSTLDNPVEGISSVKALKIANDQGVQIYTVNQSNIAAVLSQLQVDQQVKDDIQNAVNAGKVVTVSKTNITYKGWTGCGYIISNPETGAGAYMISGGVSGGAIIGASIQSLAAFLIPLTSPATSPLVVPPLLSCLQACLSDLAHNVLQDYLKCQAIGAITSVTIGVAVPSIIVLFEPYLLPALVPAIFVTTVSTLYISFGICNLRAGVTLLSGTLGCVAGCGGY